MLERWHRCYCRLDKCSRERRETIWHQHMQSENVQDVEAVICIWKQLFATMTIIRQQWVIVQVVIAAIASTIDAGLAKSVERNG